MRRILLIRHGEMAKGVLNTLHVFANDIENITAICAYTDDCQDPQAEVERFFQKAVNDQVICFSDIIFGSVNQALIPYLSRPDTYIFTGLNLPMLLQAMALPDNATYGLIKELVDEGKKGILFMNEYNFQIVDDEE